MLDTGAPQLPDDGTADPAAASPGETSQDGIDVLLKVAVQISHGDYQEAQSLFNITQKGKYPPRVEALAEAFGLMLVQVEARQYHSTLLIEQLRESNVRLERALQELDQKTRLMVLMVHELKSPIALARMMVDVLEDQHEGNQVVTSTCEKIASRMDSLLALIGEIMELFRASGRGGAHACPEQIDVTALTARALDRNRELGAGTHVSVVLEAPGTPVTAWFDPRIFDLAISNLISNALKYTCEGSVRVSVSRGEDYARISVADTGLGIPVGDMAELFRPFFRATNVRKSGIAGTGIGLSTIRDLVIGLGGTLEATSEENKGSTFTLAVPSRPANADMPQAETG